MQPVTLYIATLEKKISSSSALAAIGGGTRTADTAVPVARNTKLNTSWLVILVENSIHVRCVAKSSVDMMFVIVTSSRYILPEKSYVQDVVDLFGNITLEYIFQGLVTSTALLL